MQFDMGLLFQNLTLLKEKDPYQEDDLKRILELIAGKKDVCKNVTLSEIAYYINRVDDIIDGMDMENYPNIQLRKLTKSEHYQRRAI